MSRKKLVVGVLALLALILAVIPFLVHAKGRSNKNARPNIVLIILDAVRRDGLSLYENSRNTTPSLDKFAKEGAVFTNAYSTTCWTLSSHASLFTGLYSFSHGATQEHLYLEAGSPTLAEVLKREGYRTVGFSSNPLISTSTNLVRGFSEFYEMWKADPVKAEGGLTNAKVRDWFRRNENPAPFFLFINYMDAHRPYWPPKKYENLYLNAPLTPEYDLKLNVSFTAYYTGKIKYDTADFEAMRGLYDGEIRYLDDIVGDLIGILKENGQFNNTVIIITSDHGENIGDHGHIDHIFSLYDTTLRIPLIIHYPALFGDRVIDNRKVQLVDLFPTILHAAQADPKRYPSSGIDLLESKEESKQRPIFAEYYYPEQVLDVFAENERNIPSLDKYKRRMCSLELDGFKLIWSSNGAHELYHVEKDSGENTNLVSQNPGRVESLTNAIQAYRKRLPASVSRSSNRNEPQFDKESRERLRSLGYVK